MQKYFITFYFYICSNKKHIGFYVDYFVRIKHIFKLHKSRVLFSSLDNFKTMGLYAFWI